MYEKEQSKTLKSSTWIAIDVDWLSDEDLEKFISRHAIGDTHCEEDSGLRGRLDFIRHNLVLMIRNQKASISAKDRRAYHSNLEKRTEKLLQILDGIPEDIMYDLYLAGAIGKPVTSKYGIPGRMLDRNKLGEITRELEMIHKAAKEAGALLANKKDTNRADKWLLVEIGKMYEDFTGRKVGISRQGPESKSPGKPTGPFFRFLTDTIKILSSSRLPNGYLPERSDEALTQAFLRVWK